MPRSKSETIKLAPANFIPRFLQNDSALLPELVKWINILDDAQRISLAAELEICATLLRASSKVEVAL
jgi:hypothetical protein